ncbi:MAG: cation transporter [Sandaracinaceae bacterium]|nr:cation transporter [Sandaracinaceae bacterium]
MADSGHGSKKVILLALAANFGIACAKLAAFFFTGSTALLAEAVHSLADTGNQLLLLLGMRRAAKPPDAQHPFGYKMESYFWSFIVAILLFSLGGLFAIYEGFHKLHELEAALRAGRDVHMENPAIAIGVLAVSIALEGWSWIAATREVNHLRGDQGLFSFIEDSKSTEIIVIWMEDTGALIGLFLALAGVGLVLATGNPYWDVYSTFAIGGLLVLIAFFVARETKSLLIGEGASKATLAKLEELTTSHEGVTRLVTMRTMQLGEDELLVALKVQWEGDLTADEVSRLTNALEVRIRAELPMARFLFIEPDVYDPEKAATDPLQPS